MIVHKHRHIAAPPCPRPAHTLPRPRGLLVGDGVVEAAVVANPAGGGAPVGVGHIGVVKRDAGHLGKAARGARQRRAVDCDCEKGKREGGQGL